jgi:hypothetical protein
LCQNNDLAGQFSNRFVDDLAICEPRDLKTYVFGRIFISRHWLEKVKEMLEAAAEKAGNFHSSAEVDSKSGITKCESC